MKSLYGKFLLITALIMIFSSLGGFLLSNTYYHRVIKEQNDAKNVEIAKNITRYIEQTPDLNLPQYLTTIAGIGYQLYVTDQTGNDAFYGGEYRIKKLEESTKTKVLEGQTYHGMSEFPRQTFVTGFFANELSNSVGVPFTHNQNQYALFIRPNISLLFSEVHTILGGLILGTAILSLLSMLAVAKMMIVPLTQLTKATKRIANEHYDKPLKIGRKDEIGQLAVSFNRMMDQLQQNDRMRKEFISNVSHDFQSPLQNIQGYAILMKSESLTCEERSKYADIIQSETKRLSSLTGQLLLLTSLDQSARRLKLSRFRLDEQITASVKKYRWRLEEEKIDLYMTMEPTFYRGDQALFEKVWDNLITNAIKYNKPDGEIQISIDSQENGLEVKITNTGQGITESEQDQIFDRFYRADASRTKEGTGLGLAIVKQIVELHQGSIKVTSIPNQETTFTLQLPQL